MTLNRPCVKLKTERIAQNLIEWRQGYSGKIFLEILLVKGINDTRENLELLEDFIHSFRPERVDVVTMTRPGAYTQASPVSEATLKNWRKNLKAEKIANQETRVLEKDLASSFDPGSVEQKICNSLKRRPQSIPQLAWGLALPINEVQKTMDRLFKKNKTKIIATQDKEDYFTLQEHEID